jgi:pimeloyl-ACP methyl ester carboxylesterase
VSENQRPLTFGLIHGSWHGPESWNLVRGELEGQGHRVIVIDNLPTQDPAATREDHAQIAAQQLDGQAIDALVAHSGGAQIVPRILELRASTIRKAIYVSGSFGEPGPDDPRRLTIPRQRNSPEFRDLIIKLNDGSTIFDPSKAEEVFYHDLPKDLASLAVRAMRRQFRLEDPPLPQEHGIPGAYILGKEDKIRNPDWVRAVTRALGMRLIYMDGGHSLPLSQPTQLASLLIHLAAHPRPANKPQPSGRPPYQRKPLPYPIQNN